MGPFWGLPVIGPVRGFKVSSLLQALRDRRELFAGGFVILLGLGTILQGRTYEIGTLTHMGPGFFPIVLGLGLTAVGILIAGNASASSADESESVIPAQPQWRAWLCIIAGPLAFIVFGKYGGLIPATFACVFLSALGDRGGTLKGALLLAAAVTALGVVLFSFVLHVPFPLLRWGSL